MVYPVGIMGGLRSPFASSIRQPRMLPNNSSLPIRRGGEDQDGPEALPTQGPVSFAAVNGSMQESLSPMAILELEALKNRPVTPNPKDRERFTNIEQGFFDSPEYEDYLRAGSGMGTADVRFSPYFGQQGSGSIGQAQDKAYEAYLNRTGMTDYLKGGSNFTAAEGYQNTLMGNLKPVEGGLGSFDPRGPNVPGNRPPNPNNGLIDPYARPRPGQPIEINPNAPIDPGFTPPEFRRPRPGYRPDGFNPNMYQRPMRRPFGFGGRPMMMGMGLGMGLGMGMFGGMNPMMYGLGGANPYGMRPYTNFGRPQFPQYPQPSYGYQPPNPYMRPQPQPSPYSSYYQQPQPNYGMTFRQPSYGGYQQPSGYGNYGQMPNPYAPQQQPSYQQGGFGVGPIASRNGFGGNTNNYSGYGQLQNYDMLF